MEKTPQEEVEDQQKGSSRARLQEIVSRLNIPFLIGAAIAGIVAASSDPWWSVRSAISTNILRVDVSPYYVSMTGLGIPSTVPNADVSGLIVRVAVGVTAVALAWQGLFPLSIWRKPVLWLSLSVVAGTFLNFALLVHSTQLILLQQYGFVPQLTGSTVIPGAVLGTDFVTYSSPTISSSLGLSFFGCLAAFIVIGGSELAQYMLLPKLGLDAPQFLTGLTGALLSPPYQHAWLTSSDQGLNPLGQDPDKLTDDQLARSFEKLLKALKPGAEVSVILPPWATRLSSRLIRVVSWTGFDLENSQVIFRAPGRPENELVFRKPTPPELAESQPSEQAADAEPVAGPEPPARQEYRERGGESDLGSSFGSDEGLSNDLYQSGRPREIEGPPVEEQFEDPAWARPELDPQEAEIINSAVKLLESAGEPIPYRELINHVYLDLTSRHVGFESGSQIEVVLLQRVGKELSIFEHLDETGANVVRAWWLGEGEVPRGSAVSNKMRTRLSEFGRRFGKFKGLLGSRRRSPIDEEEKGGEQLQREETPSENEDSEE